MRTALSLVLFLFTATLSADSPATPVRILFVGNSLTYTNDLPAMVAAIAKTDGRPIETAVAAYPNYSLEDHLRDGRAIRMLRGAKWDFVVMQQGPSAMPDSRQLLIRDSVRFAKLIRKAGATPVMLSVWPSMSRRGDVDRVIESYRLAAESSGSLLANATDSWKTWMEDQRGAALYGADGFHPSEAGSRLAAETLYRALFAR